MAITQSDLDQLRNEFEVKLARVTIESMNSATAIGAYGERFNAMDAQFVAVNARFTSLEAQIDNRFDGVDRRFGDIDRRLDRLEDKLDSRFGWQTVMFAALAFLTLFGDAARSSIGL